MRVKGEPGKGECAGNLAALLPGRSRYPDDLLQCSIEHENIDGCRDAIGGTGNAKFFRRGIMWVADHKDRDQALLPDLEDCLDTLRGEAAEIENDDVKVAVAQQVEKMGLYICCSAAVILRQLRGARDRQILACKDDCRRAHQVLLPLSC